MVNLPDKAGREAILRVHTERPARERRKFRGGCRCNAGILGADLKNLVNEAALLAARRAERSSPRTSWMRWRRSCSDLSARSFEPRRQGTHRLPRGRTRHLGLVNGADPVNRVTIVPRGRRRVTYQRPDSDQQHPEAYLRARIVGMLGGRAAEEIVYGTKTTGAESDIEQATAWPARW